MNILKINSLHIFFLLFVFSNTYINCAENREEIKEVNRNRFFDAVFSKRYIIPGAFIIFTGASIAYAINQEKVNLMTQAAVGAGSVGAVGSIFWFHFKNKKQDESVISYFIRGNNNASNVSSKKNLPPCVLQTNNNETIKLVMEKKTEKLVEKKAKQEELKTLIEEQKEEETENGKKRLDEPKHNFLEKNTWAYKFFKSIEASDLADRFIKEEEIKKFINDNKQDQIFTVFLINKGICDIKDIEGRHIQAYASFQNKDEKELEEIIFNYNNSNNGSGIAPSNSLIL